MVVVVLLKVMAVVGLATCDTCGAVTGLLQRWWCWRKRPASPRCMRKWRLGREAQLQSVRRIAVCLRPPSDRGRELTSDRQDGLVRLREAERWTWPIMHDSLRDRATASGQPANLVREDAVRASRCCHSLACIAPGIP